MDDAKLGGEMTLERIATELSAIRDQISSLDRKVSAHDGKFESLERKIGAHDERFDSLERKIGAHDERFDSLERKIGAHDERFDSLERKIGAHDGKFESLDGKVDSLDARMRIGFEETHRLIKLGFESVQILDEKIDRRFDETERQHAEHRTVLEAAVKRLRRDIPPHAGPALRRRR